MKTEVVRKKKKKESNLLPKLIELDLGFEPSEQQVAIRKFIRGGKGNCFIKAVAGSGKTSTLKLISQYTPNALFLAFNNHVVNDLKAKLPPSMECRTNNSFGCKILGENPIASKRTQLSQWKIHALSENAVTPYFTGMPKYKVRAIGNQLAQLVQMVMNTMTDFNDGDKIEAMVDDYGVDLGNNRTTLVPLVPGIVKKCLDIFYSAGEISFTEQIWIPAYLGMKPRTFPDFILGDEQQDLNMAQITLMLNAMGPNTRYIGVGDPKQAMYAFTGARADAYDYLVNAFHSNEFPLSVCYRCPHSHLELAREIVPYIEDRPDCPEGVIEDLPYDKLLKEGLSVEPGDLVLSRLSAPLVIQCIRLIKNRIPAKVRGGEIGRSLIKFCDDAIDYSGEKSDDINGLSSKVETYVESQKMRFSNRRDAENQFMILDDKREAILGMLSSFGSQTYTAFKRDIESIFADEGAVTWLSTIHKAKGLEAKNVILFNSPQNKTKMPFVCKNQSPTQAEQEKNIEYVALTRAKEKLTIIR